MKEIANFLLIISVIVTIGYIGYIQSKQGIPVRGSDSVVDPFLYESGVFQDTHNGINPNSTAHHISQSQLQTRKLKKMSNFLIFAVPTIIILFFASRKKSDPAEQRENTIAPEIVNNDFPNFKKFCENMKDDLLIVKIKETTKCIEYQFPIITFGKVILNKNWNFHLGRETNKSQNRFYLYCISKGGDILESPVKFINANDLSFDEYEKLFSESYLEIISNPKYHLITSKEI